MRYRVVGLVLMAALVACGAVQAREWHVAKGGSDTNDGSALHPLKTIQAAAERAVPGDVVTVHEGVYRERVAPPRGGRSDSERIVFQAAPGERVVIKGSEPVRGWMPVGEDTWKVTLPNTFFGDFNPYADEIHGDWFNPRGRVHHTGAVYLNEHWLTEAAKLEDVLAPAGEQPLWFARVDDATTTIWAQFPEVNPNEANVEINVRQTVFYPPHPGVDYLTVRGFVMMHAATPWAPPTAEQKGLIGTHWSKGWIIEDNDIRYSVCVGIALGKYGDEFDNTSQNTATGYVETINRALAVGWSKEKIGGHIVRRNHISHCEQAGIVGSLGAAFSTITDNEIHDIHVRRLFSGAEMAGIKIHAALDTLIARNHIHHTCRGIWLDWMAQGTRVTQNLLHDNEVSEDLFVEVDHGPFLVDNNLMLSWAPKNPGEPLRGYSVRNWSEGGAYVHNLFAAGVLMRPELRRKTPYMKAHSTEVAGLIEIQGGDDRFFNNIFLHRVSDGYKNLAIQPLSGGNVLVAVPQQTGEGQDGQQTVTLPEPEISGVVVVAGNPFFELAKRDDGYYLRFEGDPSWREAAQPQVVTTALLGKARIPDLPFVQPDDSAYRIVSDFFGRPRNESAPFPGPFAIGEAWPEEIKVWPIEQP
ncbi:hypothetical protein JCM19992_14490 [Thermostilla marina]